MNRLSYLLAAALVTLASFSAAVEPPAEPDIGELTESGEHRSPEVIENYTPDEAIAEDNAIALPSDI